MTLAAPGKKRWDRSPDCDSGVTQDLPVAGPRALGVSVVAGRLWGAHCGEGRLLRGLTQVLGRGRLTMQRLEAELAYTVNLHE